MGTKNLARTVIEGGRDGWSKRERRASHGVFRAADRDWLRAGGDGAGPSMKVVRKSFADKLGPARRWLERHVGRPWDEVYAEMIATFDTRTLAGRHIVFDHMLRDVAMEPRNYWSRFRVTDGVLVEQEGWRWKKQKVAGVRRSREELEAFARGRRVGRRGVWWWWFVPVERWHDLVPVGRGQVKEAKAARFRQAERLTADEIVFWETLREDAREGLRFVPAGAPSGT